MRKAIREANGCEYRPDSRAVVRFMAFVEVDENGCWLWTGYTDYSGYGQFKWNGRAWWAHRVAFLIFNGPLEPGEQVDHDCRVSSCVNPDHLLSKERSCHCRESAHERWNGNGEVKDEIPI